MSKGAYFSYRDDSGPRGAASRTQRESRASQSCCAATPHHRRSQASRQRASGPQRGVSEWPSISVRRLIASRSSLFDRDGYVVLDDFLTPAETEALRAAGDSLARNVPQEERRSVFADQGRDEYFLNSGDKVAYFYEKGALAEDGTLLVEPHLALNKVGHALHEKVEPFRDVTNSERVKDVCRALGLDTPAVAQSMYIYKNPGVGGEVTPHQDASYLYMDPPDALLGLWIPLDDATLENGCLWFIPGSHKGGVHTRFIRNPNEDSKDLLIYDRPQPTYQRNNFVPVPVPKGSLVLIHGLVVHQSDRNKSDKSRHAYTFHVVDLVRGSYAEDNWLQPTDDAPFSVLYSKSWV